MGDEIDSLSSVLTVLEERARKLRAAGVLSFRVGDLDVQLAPHEEPMPTSTSDTVDEDEYEGDPLDNPATYGRKEGVPGFKALRRRQGHEMSPHEED